MSEREAIITLFCAHAAAECGDTPCPPEKRERECNCGVRADLILPLLATARREGAEEMRGLLREARYELSILASHKDDTGSDMTAGLRATARAHARLVAKIDAAFGGDSGGEGTGRASSDAAGSST